MTTQTNYRLDDIIQQRLKKKEEIKTSKAHMQQVVQDLFAPQESKNKVEGLMQHVNTGIAAYDGIMTGFKILKRVRSFFAKFHSAKKR